MMAKGQMTAWAAVDGEASAPVRTAADLGEAAHEVNKVVELRAGLQLLQMLG